MSVCAATSVSQRVQTGPCPFRVARCVFPLVDRSVCVCARAHLFVYGDRCPTPHVHPCLYVQAPMPTSKYLRRHMARWVAISVSISVSMWIGMGVSMRPDPLLRPHGHALLPTCGRASVPASLRACVDVRICSGRNVHTHLRLHRRLRMYACRCLRVYIVVGTSLCNHVSAHAYRCG